jgi:hypothetical protein
MENKLYYTINTIAEDSFSELDFELYEEIFGEINFDKHWPFSIDVKKYHSVDGHPIQIDRLIDLLTSFKERGANYVALHHHSDHIGYDLEAYDIHKSSEEEINSFLKNEKEEEVKKKQKEIDLLQKKLDSLKGSL